MLDVDEDGKFWRSTVKSDSGSSGVWEDDGREWVRVE